MTFYSLNFFLNDLRAKKDFISEHLNNFQDDNS